MRNLLQANDRLASDSNRKSWAIKSFLGAQTKRTIEVETWSTDIYYIFSYIRRKNPLYILLKWHKNIKIVL